METDEPPEREDDETEARSESGPEAGPEPETETRDVSTTGGVRIIGAQEASEAVGRGESRPPQRDEDFGELSDDERPVLRFPSPIEARDPSSFGAVPVVRIGDEPPEGVEVPDAGADETLDESFELPHYSDPPTGQVPRVVVGESDDASDSWSGLSSMPRWRDQDQSFDDPDFSDLIDDGPRLGALDDPDAGGDDFFDLGSDLDESSGYGDDDEVLPATRRQASRGKRRRGGGDGDGGDDDTSAASRNVPVAVAVGVGLAAVGLLCFVIGAVPTTILIAVVMIAASAEFFGVVRSVGYNPATLLGLVAVGSLAVAPLFNPALAYPVVGGVTVMTLFIWYLWVSPGNGIVTDLGVSLLGIAWIGGLGSFATLTLGVPRAAEERLGLGMESNPGIGILFGAVLVSVSYDVGGFFIGKYFGRTPLSDVSPNKTQEGLIGGFFVALFVPFIVLKFLPGIAPLGDNAAKAFAFCLFCAIVAPFGDLSQSMVKRDLGVKDMGTILPAHGGVLDRFDALLFVLPMSWFISHLLEVSTKEGFVF